MNDILFKHTFDKNILNMNSLLHKSFNTFKNGKEHLSDCKLKIFNNYQNNIGSILIHNFKIPSIQKSYYERCNDIFCKTCKFANLDYYIQLKPNFFLPILDFSSCVSDNCVYLIKCKHSNAFYVGETSNIKKRMANHISKIKRFSPYEQTNHNATSVHFNMKTHFYLQHFSFYVIKTDMGDHQERLKFETF